VRTVGAAELERDWSAADVEAARLRAVGAAELERDRLAADVEVARVRAVGAAELERDRLAADVEAARVRDVGVAEAAGEAARVAALRDVPVDVLGVLALRELAARLPDIGQLTITPDVLTGLVARLATPSIEAA
jgi:DNA-binding protein